MISLYLAIGIGFYVGLAVKSLKTFDDAKPIEIFGGFVLAVFLWPVGIVVAIKNEKD